MPADDFGPGAIRNAGRPDDRGRGLIAFFALTYAFTWCFTIPLVICYRVVLDGEFAPWLLVFLPGAFGPTIVALWLTHRREGSSAVVSLLRRLIPRRTSWGWMVAVVVGPTVWVIAAVFAAGQSHLLRSFDVGALVAAAPLYWLAALPFGPLAEELGWRGYALPRLLARTTPLKASLMLGTAWTFWHAPMFWFPGAAIPSALPLSLSSIGVYWVQLLALTVLFTLVFNRTGQSVFAAVVFHTTFNASENIVFDAIGEPEPSVRATVYVATVAIMALLAALSVPFLNRRQAAGRSALR